MDLAHHASMRVPLIECIETGCRQPDGTRYRPTVQDLIDLSIGFGITQLDLEAIIEDDSPTDWEPDDLRLLVEVLRYGAANLPPVDDLRIFVIDAVERERKKSNPDLEEVCLQVLAVLGLFEDHGGGTASGAEAAKAARKFLDKHRPMPGAWL